MVDRDEVYLILTNLNMELIFWYKHKKKYKILTFNVDLINKICVGKMLDNDCGVDCKFSLVKRIRIYSLNIVLMIN